MPSKLPAVVRKIKQQLSPHRKNANGVLIKRKPITFGDVQDALSDVSAAISVARAAGEGGVVKRLVELKNALRGQADVLAGSATDAGKRALKAVTYFKQVYAPRFRDGVGGAFAKADRRGAPLAPSAAAGTFVRTGPGSLEAGQDLARIIDGSANPAQARESVRSFVLSRLSKAAVNPRTGRFDEGVIAKFLETYSDALKSFPGVRREIETLGRGARARRGLANQLEQEIKVRAGAQKATEREIDQSVAAVYVGNDPKIAMGKILAMSDPETAMKELVAAARKDKSGRAFRGLRTALSEHINSRVRKTTVNIQGDDFVIVGREVEGLFKDSRTARAMEQLYTADEIKVLQRVRDQIRVMNRINTQVTSGSPTAPLQKNVSRVRIVLASLYGIVRGRGVFAISGWVADRLGIDPAAKANAVLLDAMLDPQLARMMLLPDTPKTAAAMGSRLETAAIASGNVAAVELSEIGGERAPMNQTPQR